MSSLVPQPANFLTFNNQQSKNLNIVADIAGLPLLSLFTVNRTLNYGDPVHYGDPGLVYAGLIPVGTIASERQQKNLLMLDGGALTISQQLEPEQARGSISTLSMTFLDKDGYMTLAVSSGGVVPEILGLEVKIWIGYLENAWPQDYYVVWRGRVSQVVSEQGRVTLQFVDPNVVRRQQILYPGQTTIPSNVASGDANIPVAQNGGFFNKITGPNGSYDNSVRCFIKIDDEYIEYQQSGSESTGYGNNVFTGVVRGAQPISNLQLPSVPSAHTAGASVDGYILLSGHAMDIALKLMMSGWGGPFLSGQAIYSLVTTDDIINPSVSNGIVLPVNTDGIRDLGITAGDFITITGDGVPGNNVTCTVLGFSDLTNQPNRVVLTSATFTSSDPSTATIAIRSQYDVLPTGAGCQLPGWEVDVQTFQFYKNTYLSNPQNQYTFFLNGAETGKTFIESEILLPIGAYSLTRQGKISMGLTKPPLADQSSQVLSISNILDPASIKVQRGVNNRKFFNEVDWSFDCDDTNTATTLRNALDATSLGAIGISSILPITTRGSRTSLGFLNVVASRETWLFNRYSRGSVILDLKTTLTVGTQIEVGDIVVVNDQGNLQIPNFSTGLRNFGTQYMEVINRSLDLRTGLVSLTLEGGTGSVLTDRFATVAPSSLIVAGSTASRIIITESFGAVFPGNEQKKWTSYVGLKVRVYSTDFLNDGTTVFTGFDPTNNHAMLLAPALSFTPGVNYIVDLGQYPNNSSTSDQSVVKLIHAYVDPTVSIVSGTSHTVFTVGGGDISKFAIGQTLILHDSTWARQSPEVTILSINTNTITVSADLGFFPDASIQIELIGFPDGGQPYRMI